MPFIRRTNEVADRCVRCRVTENEEAAILEAAERAGVTVSTWLRDVAMAAATLPVAATPAPMPACNPEVVPPTPPPPPAPMPIPAPPVGLPDVATVPEATTLPVDPRAFAALLREAAKNRYQVKPGVVLSAHVKASVAPAMQEDQWQARLAEAAYRGLLCMETVNGRSGYIRVV